MATRNRVEGGNKTSPRSESNDPTASRVNYYQHTYSDLIDDPIYGKIAVWRKKQTPPRVCIDRMLVHPAVAAPLRFIQSSITSIHPIIRPSVRNPTNLQVDIAEFAQHQIDRLGSSGDPRQGYANLVGGAWLNGFAYGFSLSELETEYAPFKGNMMVQGRKVKVLPQASLDTGFRSTSPFSSAWLDSELDYRCFKMDRHGEITGYTQFAYSGHGVPELLVEWNGNRAKQILHFVHNGGDNSPYGDSALNPAFPAWSELYKNEQIQSASIDHSSPLLVINRQADRPAPELHSEVEEAIMDPDPIRKLLILAKADAKYISPAMKEFVEHMVQVQNRDRGYINSVLLAPASLYAESTENDGDNRNMTSIFYKHTLPSILSEWGNFLENQYLRRLIQANYSNLTDADYPKISFPITQSNDLRVQQAMFAQLIPMMDAKRLGEFAATTISGFNPDWIATSLDSSVKAMFQEDDKMKESKSGDPPVKEHGEARQRLDGETENMGDLP